MIIAFNKPHGVLCQFTPGRTAVAGRPTLRDFIPIPGVYPAGRLDTDSEGLLILTDEGRLARQLTEPSAGHPRTYLAQVEKIPTEVVLQSLRRGVDFEGKKSRPAGVRRIEPPVWLWPRDPPVRVRQSIPTAWLEIILTEGRNRQVRKMTAAVGHPTLRLIRAAVGGYRLNNLAPGKYVLMDAVGRRKLEAGQS